ncbi:hypothetical protein [Chryseobacterium sp. CFBP8996]|uniref:hypothetical protein n=1 Tax=Chryseobacterium sp. CFBP8996 TaxID=3096529 RepID=UPI002A6B0C2C|nr:hypothetical protein [Chryseobacterium sp. CFBP8996]MDY0932113.1 hypothetical protein [Chryseobacterium sp. CFBP8996]
MNYTEKLERLKILLTGASTNITISSENETEYTNLRRELSTIQKYKSNTPRELVICSTLQEFRREMQSKGGYAERRNFISTMFFKLLTDDDSLLDSIEEIQQNVNFGQLNLLPQDIQEKGKEMSEVYLYLYCIENSLRIFISEIMKSETVIIPRKVQETIDRLKKSEKESKYLPIRGGSDLFYCDFIELGKIIVGNWAIFGKYFPKQNEHWLNVMVDELYKIRCLVAHNSYVGKDEKDALKVFYKIITSQLKQ